MAMSYVIRKTSPTVVPLALRAISISSARVVLPESGSFRSHQFSTVAVDKKLIKVLKSEIKSMRRTRSQVLKSLIESTEITIPADFPFKIEDKEKYITLKRELPAENIEIIICKPSKNESDTLIDKDSSTDDDESDTDSDNDSSSDTDNNDNSSSTDSTSDDEEEKEDDNDSSSDTDNNDNSSSTDSTSDDEEEKEHDNANPSLVGVPLQVRIVKKDGSFMNTRVLGCADEIIVEHIEIYASPSPDGRGYFDHQFVSKFKELATDVQNSIMEYIGVRGIDKTNVEFLLKYMVRKSNNIQPNNIQPDKINESHMDFLESFKKFVDGRPSSS